MAPRIVTLEDLKTRYPHRDLTGFTPTHWSRVRGARTLDFVFLGSPAEKGIAWAFEPDSKDPTYAVVPPGKWQHLSEPGMVDFGEVRYDPNWVSPLEREGFVYFIRSTEGSVKIGWSQDPPRRLMELQVANANRLHLLGTMPGTMKLEKDLHRRFSHLKISAEWFQYTGELEDFVQTIRDTQCPTPKDISK